MSHCHLLKASSALSLSHHQWLLVMNQLITDINADHCHSKFLAEEKKLKFPGL